MTTPLKLTLLNVGALSANIKLFLTTMCCTAALTLSAHAVELVTNGDFETGGPVTGGDPTGWNSTTNPTFTGQIAPSGLILPLSGKVAYIESNNQIAQTFSIGLQPSTTYRLRFDAYLINPDNIPTDTIRATIAYGTGSGDSSFFFGNIRTSDIAPGGTSTFVGTLTTAPQSYDFSFSTPAVINGSREGSLDEPPQTLGIFFDPQVTYAFALETTYLDNVSVTTTAVPEPSTWALLGAGLCAMVFVRRRRVA